MIKLPNDMLNRLRPLPHALADLVAKHDQMQLNHPERADLARMIWQLEAELTYRARKAVARQTSRDIPVRACAGWRFGR
jgi:hypothetical protein